jgi:hypothetical protein
MASEQQIEVYRQHRTSQEKYIYFLLAAAGAGVALAVNQTQGARLSWSKVPLAYAVVSWGLSFFFGCRHLQYVTSTMFANAHLLQVQAGEHPLAGTHPQRMAAASEGIREAIKLNSNKASGFARMQFGALILGAICYIGWHVYEMWLRS